MRTFHTAFLLIHYQFIQMKNMWASSSYQTALARQGISCIINYSKTTRNIPFIDVSASHRKPSSGLSSDARRQYVKACPIRGSVGSSPRLNSCSPSS